MKIEQNQPQAIDVNQAFDAYGKAFSNEHRWEETFRGDQERYLRTDRHLEILKEYLEWVEKDCLNLSFDQSVAVYNRSESAPQKGSQLFLLKVAYALSLA